MHNSSEEERERKGAQSVHTKDYPSQRVHNNYKGKERKASMQKIIFLNFSHCSCITKFRNDGTTMFAIPILL